MSRSEKIASGLLGLDQILQNIRLGDSVLWQISNIEDYAYFVRAYAAQAISEGKNVIYFRFAEHPPLLEEQEGLKIITLDVDMGFEGFTVKVYEIIEQEGLGSYYIFDCISELQSVWAADFMMRNFFMAICPSLSEMKASAYFSIMRSKHSYSSIKQTSETASIVINTIKGKPGFYVHPLKVVNRHSKTMFLPHLIKDPDGEEMIPLTDGISSSKYYSLLGPRGLGGGGSSLDNWDIFFLNAREAMGGDPVKKSTILDKLYKILIGRDPERAQLFKEHFTIQDYLDINERLIGSGSIGGKAAGMLLSRKIIENSRPDLADRMEAHDSFYIGSNVFYTFLISNNWWKLWLEHKTDEGYFLAAKALKSQLSYGQFPEMVRDKFRTMLDHFGQNPIIVRSSSFLEDGFGNAFAGKYDSVFCVNAGTPEERYERFVAAVKEVYASAMDESALVYRQKRGLDKSDEQMSILVQRVSGSILEDIFMPGAAGVGYSINSYAWNKEIDPEAGMVRIVAGLGTRAVDRTYRDYPRIAPLDKPHLSPMSSAENKFQFVQRKVDVLDFSDNALVTIPIEEVSQKSPPWLRNLIIEHDYETEERLRSMGRNEEIISTSCDKILKDKRITETMREMLQTIHQHYQYPVDIEFTINFSEDGEFLINVVQCRPLQAKGTGAHNVTIPQVPDDKLFFKLFGNVMGGPIERKIDLVAIVDGKSYADMPFNNKFSVSRAIEAINQYAIDHHRKLMLLGPGRWGTSSAELGVPIRFAQISNVKAIFEMSFQSSGLMPELSFGSHFFQDLVETDIFYGAIFEQDCIEGRKSIYHPEIFEGHKNLYKEIYSSNPALESVISVYDAADLDLTLISDTVSGETVCCSKAD